MAGNLFSLVFGRNLDAHDNSPASNTLKPPLAHAYSAPRCSQGINCYVDTIYLTMVATFLAIILSIWAGYRDRLKIASAMSHKTKVTSTSEVIWEDVEGGL